MIIVIIIIIIIEVVVVVLVIIVIIIRIVSKYINNSTIDNCIGIKNICKYTCKFKCYK